MAPGAARKLSLQSSASNDNDNASGKKEKKTTKKKKETETNGIERYELIVLEGEGGNNCNKVIRDGFSGNNHGTSISGRRSNIHDERVDDVYTQLDELEHLLDLELESMEKLGFLDVGRCVVAASSNRMSNGRSCSRSGRSCGSSSGSRVVPEIAGASIAR